MRRPSSKHINASFGQKSRQYKFFLLLATLYITALLATIPVAYRLVGLGHFATVSASIFLFPITYTLGDIIAEVYGYQAARQVIWCAILADLLFAFAVTGVIHIPSTSNSMHQAAFIFVLGSSIRLVLGGVLGILVGEFLNIYVLTKLKILTRGRYFWLRSLGSSFIGEFLTLSVCIVIAFHGRKPFPTIIKVICSMYVVEMCYLFIGVWPASIIAFLLKRAEGVNVFDIGTTFNPFKYKIEE